MKQLPVERYFTAIEKIKKMKRFSTADDRFYPSKLEAPELKERIPKNVDTDSKDQLLTTDALNGSTVGALGSWTALGPGNIGGRTRGLLVDPNTPSIMYAGAVDGGIWKTTDGGANWLPLNDFLANSAVTSLVFDPNNSSTIYAGTGEGFSNADGVRGAGIFKSTDAGATWNRLSFTASNTDFYYVNDLVVGPANAQHLYAATRTGVHRSLDGGATWTNVLISNATNGAGGAMDLVMRTDATGQASDYIYAAVGTFAQAHIYRNTDAGGAETWTDVYTEAAMGRTSLAISPSNQNIVYALAASIGGGSYNNGLLAVFRSASSGDAGSWTTQVRNNSANKQDTLLLSNPVFGSGICIGGSPQYLNQGWYDNQIEVDPSDSNVIWVAGIDIWRSDNAGANWGVASYWWFQNDGVAPANGDPQLVHADNHRIVFAPGYNGTTNQTMFVGDDGGVYKTTNAKTGNVGYVNGSTPSGGTITATSPICGTPVASAVSWASSNNGYQVTQFNQGLPYPDGTTYFGGTQDNGTNRGTDAAGVNQWSRIQGGDGGYVGIDPTNTNVLYTEFTGLSLKKSTDGGASFASATSGIGSDAFPFYTVHLMDPSNPSRLWIGGQRMWRTVNAAANWTQTSPALTGGSITAIAIAPTNPNRVFAGVASGRIASTNVGTTSTSATAWTFVFTPRGNGNGTISWLAFDPTNDLIAYATISTFNGTANVNGTNAGHVFKTTDGGLTWTLVDGTQTPGNVNAIPDISAHSIVVDPADTQRLYVGTDLGVFVSFDGGANWAQETSGFSNVVTESLSLVNNGGVRTLFAFTHGRSAFKVTIPTYAAPVAVADNYSTLVNTALNVAASGVLGNDTNVANTNLTASLVTSPANAAAFTLNADGSFSYTPNANFVGTDSFTYRIGVFNSYTSTATVTINVDPSADLAIMKTASPAPVIAGNNLAYTIMVSNSGPNDASSVSVADTLPAGTTFVSLTSPSGWTCTTPAVGDGGTVNCSTGSLANGVTGVFTLTVKVGVCTPGGTNLSNTSTVSSTTADANATNNSATATTGVTAEQTPPVIDPYSNIIVNLPANSGATSAVVNFPLPTASDNCGGATVTTSPASGSAFPVGTTTVQITATDAAGNQAFGSFTVTVNAPTGYLFSGFFAPISNTGLNSQKAGSNVAVKFSLNGYQGLDILAAGSPSYQQVNCSTGAIIGTAQMISSPGTSSLSYNTSTDQYQINWKTDKSLSGTCQRLNVTLNDGSNHTADFQFK